MALSSESRKIGLMVKDDPYARVKADEFEAWLRRRQLQVVRHICHLPAVQYASAPPDLFGVFVLGGDGSFLSAVRWIGDAQVPVLGIKFGEVGFLAGIAEKNLYPAAEAVLQGDFSTSTKMRLVATVTRNGEEIARETVLNDVVINKGALARLASIKTEISGRYLTTYRADGLIVATPTGSTAYSLAAGGPVVHPSVAGIIMTPICPFTLTNRPLIIPDQSEVTIRIGEEAADIMVTFDGQSGGRLEYEDVLCIRQSPYPVRTIRVPAGQDYYDLLKSKLHWSGGRV